PRYEKYVSGRVNNGKKPSSLTEWVKFAEEQYEKGQLDGPDGSRRLVVKEVKPAVKPESKPKKKSGQRVR
ncbi:MAG: hypothetical protein LH609_16115, partial [Rudanella sp.]|nr:hypothetical protein [Rudanella sp.]